MNNKTISNGWIDNKLFPESQNIFDNRFIFLDELNIIVNQPNLWPIWQTSNSDKIQTPNYSEISEKEIFDFLNKNAEFEHIPAWRLFPIIYNKNVVSYNSKYIPKTLSFLMQYSDRILTAAFSKLDSGNKIRLHKDSNDSFYRIHIPLIIPSNNDNKKGEFLTESEIEENLAVLRLDDDYRIWKSDKFFIIDDTHMHSAWNNTQEDRIVLLIDFLK